MQFKNRICITDSDSAAFKKALKLLNGAQNNALQ